MKLQRYYPKTPHIRRVLYEKKSGIFEKVSFKVGSNCRNIQFGTLKKSKQRDGLISEIVLCAGF